MYAHVYQCKLMTWRSVKGCHMLQIQKRSILRKRLVTGSWHIKAGRDRAQWDSERERERDKSREGMTLRSQTTNAYLIVDDY